MIINENHKNIPKIEVDGKIKEHDCKVIIDVGFHYNYINQNFAKSVNVNLRGLKEEKILKVANCDSQAITMQVEIILNIYQFQIFSLNYNYYSR